MNLNFTFTTRDKILLLVLAVILFVGMMYLYGVMPANEEVEDLEGQISAKQQELAQLQAQIAGINIAGIDAEYDKLLDYYYTADRGELAENIGIIAINRMIIAVLDEHNISGYSTTGWRITEEKLTGSYGDYTGDYYIASATCPVPYTAAPEDLYALIDYVNEDPFLIMTDLSINYVEETPETEEPTEPGTDTEPDGSRHRHGSRGARGAHHQGGGQLQPHLLYARPERGGDRARVARHRDGAYGGGGDPHLRLRCERDGI